LHQSLALGKRSVALGGGLHQSLALKGRNKRQRGQMSQSLGQEPNMGLVPVCVALSGLPSGTITTPFAANAAAFAWADMSRPFGAQEKAVFHKIPAKR
jgi:hypothetical protein